MARRVRFVFVALSLAVITSIPSEARAQDRLCDPANENCRTLLINLIRNELVGIDVAFWFMEDARFSNELIARFKAGVPVRVLVDTRANSSSQWNADRLKELSDAGIPMRRRTASGILHWKMMLFSGQNTVQFSAANYSANAWTWSGSPYTNYTDEAIYFTDDAKVVNSFRTKYDDLWIDTTSYGNYANISSPLVRTHAIFAKDPELNFPPKESFASRSITHYNAETQRIDATIYRITDRRHTDALIAARARGVTVRIITEPAQYRDVNRLWHSWNVDRLYMAGVQIRHRQHAGLNHQKSTILHSQKLSITGSSNWTSPSDTSQEEHNYFTKKSYVYTWLTNQFNRKWTNSAGVAETTAFVPLPPDKPTQPTPAHFANGVSPSSLTLRWYGGPWAHLYDVYLGTDPNNLPILAANLELGPSQTSTQYQSLKLSTTLASGTTYYWRVVSKTMAHVSRSSDVWTFTTSGTASSGGGGGTSSDDVVLHAADASAVAGRWSLVSDSSAASGKRMHNPDRGDAKITTAAASPSNYFELTFNAVAGKPYRLWIRGRADGNHYANDSVFVQFSGSVNSSGSAMWRIGTSSAAEVNLEDCGGCGLAGWGWQDNGWGVGVMGPVVYFNSTGTHRIRIQQREDGLSIDQVVLSPSTYLSKAPGGLKNDTTILPKQNGGSGGSTTPPPTTGSDDIVLHASTAGTVRGNWVDVADSGAASGVRMRNPDKGAAKITTALASPANYIELTFTAQAGKGYRLWIRGRADNNYWANDSVFVQFSGSVTSTGSARWRIGTTSATEVNIEDCSGCGLSGWGWQDNGWGAGVMGPLVYFATTGTQRIRIQQREDGISIDQIVLSPSTYQNKSPGALKNDTTVLAKTQ
jgi:phosphatidylserine/phosphatidylglycerophosphate/cardiolipin synthase-like enzyme